MTTSGLDVAALNAQVEKIKEHLKAQREELKRQNQQVHDFAQSLRNVSSERNREFLSALGIDQTAFEKQAQADKKTLLEQLDNFKKAQQEQASVQSLQERALQNAMALQRRKKQPQIFPDLPPPQSDAPDWFKGFLQWLAQHSQLNGQLTPPAYSCDVGEGVDCFAATAMFKMQLESSGAGGPWGWLASPVPPIQHKDLLFLYIPQITGTLSATANVRLQGRIFATAGDNPFWTMTTAFVRMKLRCDIYQNSALVGIGNAVTVVDDKIGGNPFFFEYNFGDVFHNRYMFYPFCSGYVEANDPVFIHVGAELTGEGRSDYARVEVDFSGAPTFSGDMENGIRVPSIDVSLDPFILL